MSAQKYSDNQYLIETLLTWVKSGEIAIPEVQRSFVWDASKVRDLMDSLHQGYAVGYITAWRNRWELVVPRIAGRVLSNVSKRETV